ncbi:MAG: hypothetical protein A3F12_07475 [Gammaproteobacteria bacterium RIFCSPHIGHO2_12_FULL_38_14]|nr:MAG: hypothetical protein A3F12_07475 [Gammaproteobacteria bacterium RIFCSPHIGHO2_12_FULL_38_14]
MPEKTDYLVIHSDDTPRALLENYHKNNPETLFLVKRCDDNVQYLTIIYIQNKKTQEIKIKAERNIEDNAEKVLIELQKRAVLSDCSDKRSKAIFLKHQVSFDREEINNVSISKNSSPILSPLCAFLPQPKSRMTTPQPETGQKEITSHLFGLEY